MCTLYPTSGPHVFNTNSKSLCHSTGGYTLFSDLVASSSVLGHNVRSMTDDLAVQLPSGLYLRVVQRESVFSEEHTCLRLHGRSRIASRNSPPASLWFVLLARFLLGILFYPEDGSSMFLRNIGLRNTRRYNQEDSTVRGHNRGNLKSNGANFSSTVSPANRHSTIALYSSITAP